MMNLNISPKVASRTGLPGGLRKVPFLAWWCGLSGFTALMFLESDWFTVPAADKAIPK
ncbi:MULTISPECIES: hypothetical protein [Roseobacteraceae]|uniref:PufQ cytochrome subunit n=1 Tax=Falsiruegeria litorea TaxID=1280831 RepID=A0ABS5WPM0_9RHOB|nr:MULTISPECIES: hypothetical protein [Roseobacteraceae]MBT3141015.1 hypothetical protein [Falsiruegeria litorea]MBT8168094.1 hypothetical protein [Falsiruegeria litorea]